MAASPSFTITGAAGSLLLRTATPAESLTATVDNLAGISSVAWEVSGTDETGGTYTLTPSGSYGSTVDWTAGAAGTCGILQCTVNGGVNPQTGNVDPAMTATAKWSVTTAGGLHVVAVGEDNEHDPTYGWSGPVNAGIRAASAVAAGTFPDNTFRVYGSADATKLAAFEVDGFTTATTRTFTLPNATGTVTLDGFASTFSAIKTFADGMCKLAGSSSGTTILKATAAASGTITFPAATGTVMLTSDLGAIDDSVFKLLDDGDPTKEAVFQCSGITTGTKRTFTFPDNNGTLALLGLAQSWSSDQTFSTSGGKFLLAGSSSGSTELKASAAASGVATLQAGTGTLAFTSDILATFPDNTWRVYDNSDATKLGALDMSGLTTGNTRTLLWPDADGRILIDAGVQSISGAKTFADSTLILAGSSSGTLTLKAPAAASTYVATLPAATDTLVGKATTDTLTNKTYDTAGTGNVFRINGTAISAVTGSGSVVLATSPALTTPDIGVATATSVNKVAVTAPATSATLTIADGTTFNVNVSGPASGQILKYNGTSWVNTAIPTLSSPPYVKGADGSAAATIAESDFWRIPSSGTAVAIYFQPRASSTANNTDYATITIRHYNSAAALQNTWAVTTQISGNGTITINVPWVIASGLSTAFTLGDYFTFQLGKSGSGVAVGAGNIHIDYIPT